MKFFLITMAALIGFAAAAQLPDSATQGPNPQDIATPEPEYIDIDEPEPAAAPAPAPAPAPIQSRSFVPAAPRPVQRPIFSAPAPAPHSIARTIAQSYASPQRQYQPIAQHQQPIEYHHQPIVHHQQSNLHYQPQQHQQLPGHSYSSQSGYQYRRPAIVRRFVYRHRY